MIKKGISLIVAVSLVLTLSVSASITFKDVKGTEWFYNDLTYLASEGIINGTSNGTFAGNSLLTKDALIKTLVVASGYDVGNANGYWAQNYIDKAESLGWLDGTIEGMYTSPINRYETCRLIVNALGDSQAYPTNLFSYNVYIADYYQIPSNYKDAVLKVYALGIITGYTDNTFGGTNTLTRSEMTAILARFINTSYRKLPLDPAKLSTVKTFANDPDNKVVDPQTVKFENNRLMYFDGKTDTWVSISSSGLNPNLGRLSEDVYVELASYINSTNDMAIVTSYAYDNFFMYIDDGGSLLYTYSVNDDQNYITIDLADLYFEPYLALSTPIDQAFIKTLQVIDPVQYQAMYSFIKSHYEMNNTVTPITNTETFGSITIKTIAQQGSYSAQIIFN